MKKERGILLPISALPGAYGIGTLGEGAEAFLDYLRSAGAAVWQILPIGLVDAGNSPYQSLSAYAGNPWYIDPDELERKGFLDAEQTERERARYVKSCDRTDYDGLRASRTALLLSAFRKWRLFSEQNSAERARFENWRAASADWAEDYAAFRTLSARYADSVWSQWPEAERNRKGDAYLAFLDTTAEERIFYLWEQYEFDAQFAALKAKARLRGIRILGDMPIYVSYHSADVWSAPQYFRLNDGIPESVAGVPPDYFSEKGQVWGSPLYDFERQKHDGYRWWIRRFRRAYQLFDEVRIDHFRAFSAYYAIPYGAPDACGGHWEKGPGLGLFETLQAALGSLPVVAEDLGTIDGDVRRLLKEAGFPGMKVLQFAFDGNPDNEYLPSRYPARCVAYTGTHDNDTTLGWLKSMDGERLGAVIRTLQDDLYKLGANVPDRLNLDRMSFDEAAAYALGLMKEALEYSRAERIVLPMQDVLALGNEARLNLPGSVRGNWTWRMTAIPDRTGEGRHKGSN